MNKIVDLYLSRKDITTKMDVVQCSTEPDITFVLKDYTPPTGATARIFIKKPDSEVYNTCAISGNEVTFQPTTGSFDQAGPCVAQLEILKSGEVAVSYRIYVMVEPNTIDSGAIEASDDFTALQEALAAAGDISELQAKVGKITIFPGIEQVYFGAGTTTKYTSVYGSSIDKVGILAENNQDGKQYRLLAKEHELQLYNSTDDTTVWSIPPGKYESGDTVSFAGNSSIFAAILVTDASALYFFIPLGRLATGLSATLALNASNGLSGFLPTGGFLNGTQYINTTGSDYTIIASVRDGGVGVMIRKSSAFTGAPNNSSLNVRINGTLTFS